MLAEQLPRDQIWFALRWHRLWAVRREGKVALAKYVAGMMISVVAAGLLSVFVDSNVGIAVFILGFAASFFWFRSVQRRHTDYSISYDDYFRENNNA